MKKTKRVAFMGILLAVIVICSWISIPFTIPFTLQTFGIFLSVIVLDTWGAFLTVLGYLFLGLIGLPVFSGFKGGLGVILGPTGGYILGFLFSTLIAGKLMEIFPQRKIYRYLSMVLGLIVCYIFGTIWFIYMYTGKESITFTNALVLCVFPFVIPDLIKIVMADYLGGFLKDVYKK